MNGNEIQPTEPIGGSRRGPKKTLFVFCFLIITTQYFFFTMPIAFIVNELIDHWKHSKITTGSIVGAFSLSLATGALLSNKFTECFHPRQTLLFTATVLTVSTPILFAKFDKTMFAVVLFVTRVVQGFVIGICEPQLMSVMTSLYPDRLGFVTGSFELAASISSTIGPLIGGFIYEQHGFAITSVIPSIINCVASLGGLVLLNPSKMYTYTEEDCMPTQASETSRTTVRSLFILPLILLGMLTETIVSMVVTTIESFYPNFYSVYFNKQEGYVGAVISIAGLAYCVGTIMAGYLGDKGVSRKAMILLGLLMISISCTGIKPPFIAGNELWSAFMLCVIDFGSGMTQISILPCLIVQYQQRTHVSRETSSCQMSGLYRAGYFTGAFVGPVMGGSLLELLPYQTSYIILAVILFLNFLILFIVDLIFPHSIEMTVDRQGSYENLADGTNSE